MFEKKKIDFLGLIYYTKLKYILKCIIMKQSLCYIVHNLKKELISVNSRLEDLSDRIQNFENIIHEKNNRIRYLEVLSYGAETNTMSQLSLHPLSLQEHPDIVQKKTSL